MRSSAVGSITEWWPKLLPLWIHCHICAKATLSTQVFQTVTECTACPNWGLFLWDLSLSLETLAQGLSISLDKTFFFELCYSLRLFLPIPSPTSSTSQEPYIFCVLKYLSILPVYPISFICIFLWLLLPRCLLLYSNFSGARKTKVKLRLGDWLTHYLIGRENVILCGRWDTESAWDKVAIQFLLISPVLTWGDILGGFPCSWCCLYIWKMWS